MVALRAVKPYFWRNIYARHPVLAMELDLAGAEQWSGRALAGAAARLLLEEMPALRGAIDGLDAAALTARIALELQSHGDSVPRECGVRRQAGQPSRAVAFFACRDRHLGAASARHASALAALLTANPDAAALRAALDRALADIARQRLDPAVRELVAAANARGIRWSRTGPTGHVQFGFGSGIRHLPEGSRAPAPSDRRFLALLLLARVYLPVGRFAFFTDPADAPAIAGRIGYPIVLKPARAEGGRALAGLADAAALRAAIATGAAGPGPFILQSHLPGASHRLRVAAGRLVEAKRRGAGRTESDVTASVHPDNANAAIRAAGVLALDAAEVEFAAPDIARSWRAAGGGICGVSAVAPKRRPPPAGASAEAVLESLYPAGGDGSIPVAMITGSKGKSTTAMMLSGILARAGHNVGAALTDGVVIGRETVAFGDFAAVEGADIVLNDPSVTAAVLETARGGLLRLGIYLEECDVAALLNVGREQIGIDGIDSLDDMARLKRKVLETARHAVVLNADDARVAAMAPEFPSRAKILFSMTLGAAEMRRRWPEMDTAVFLEAGAGGSAIAVAAGGAEAVLLRVAELPSALGGTLPFNIANAMAAAGLALGLGVAPDLIAAGLRGYDNSVARTLGRFSFAEGFPVPVVFDQVLQPPGVEAAVAALRRIPVSGRRICAAVAPGNRPDWVYSECAAMLAGCFDLFVCFDREYYRRGRKPGELPAVLKRALVAAGVAPGRISLAADDREAAGIVAAAARPGDLVAVFGSDIRSSVDEYRAAFARKAGG